MFRVVLVIVALAAGGAAAWLAYSMMGVPATVAETARPVPMQEVLVASVELGRGQMLAKESMRWQSWPEGALNSAYIKKSARPDAQEVLVGSIARSRIALGEPLRGEMLLPANTSFLSATLPPGKRAVAVKISVENTAGGFILPNDRVDVILTGTPIGQGEDKQRASMTLLRNIPVLAIDQHVDENSNRDEKPKDAKDDKSKPKAVFIGKTATLEVDSREVELLATAQESGTLSLALRSMADNDEAPLVRPARAVSSPPVYIIRGTGGGSSTGDGGAGNGTIAGSTNGAGNGIIGGSNNGEGISSGSGGSSGGTAKKP